MPEAPEVAFLRDYITTHCAGRQLTSIKIMRGRYLKHGPPTNFNAFLGALPMSLSSVEKHGKVLFLHFRSSANHTNNDWCVISRLGLTGWWYADDDTPQWINTQPNIAFEFKGGRTLYYTDTLSYGTLTFTNDSNEVQKQIDKLAPDVETTTLSQLLARLHAAPQRISKQVLEDVITDQEALVSGIGNYLKAEILYDAKISPFRPVADVTKSEWKTILQSAKKVIHRMRENVTNTTEDKYMSSMRVYMKSADRHGNPVEKHRTKTGRITHWVPAVQK